MVAGKLFFVAAVLAAVLASVLPGAVLAAPADVAMGFGTAGVAQVEGPGGSRFAPESHARMAIGPEGDVFVLYSDYTLCSMPYHCVVDLAVSRYDAPGRRDGSFGAVPGSHLTVHQVTERHAFDLAVGPDGKAVVAASNRLVHGVTVARFDRSGHLDGTFGAGGEAPQPAELARDTPVAVAVQPDGKIVVAGEGSRVDGGQELVVVRYLPNGERDLGFGDGGRSVTVLPTQTRPADLLLGPGGELTVAAPLCCAGGTPPFGGGFSIARLLGDGRPDPGLGGTGREFFPTPGAEGLVETAALAPDGGVVVVFEEETPEASRVGNVVKLTPDGSLDPSFGAEGRLRLYNRVGGIDPVEITVDSSGRLVGTGRGEGETGVFRLRPDGSVDRTFNGGARRIAPFGVAPLDMGLQPGGRIVVLGGVRCCASQAFKLFGLRGGTSGIRCQGRRATIVGTRGPDEIVGTSRRDVIAALAGKDTVRGLGGPDLICGGRGRDTLFGGAGRDTVVPNPVRRRGKARVRRGHHR